MSLNINQPSNLYKDQKALKKLSSIGFSTQINIDESAIFQTLNP